MRVKSIGPWAALVLVALLALLGVSRALFGEGISWSFGISVLVIWWLTLCAAAACTVIARGRLRAPMIVSVCCAASAIVIVCLNEAGPEWLVWGLWFGAVALAHAGLLMTVNLRLRVSRLVRLATLACLVLLTAGIFPGASDLINYLIVVDEERIHRAVMTASLLVTGGTLAVYLLAAIEGGRQPPPESLPPRVALAAACPRCGAPNTFPAGRSECQSCGLAVTLDIEEPRCPCGYLLYKLDSDKCPECGRAVRKTIATNQSLVNT